MNDVSNKNNTKDSILKSLAITGFVSIIILLTWFSIKLVGIVPEAFSSLASLAEGLNQQNETILKEEELTTLPITSDKSLVNTGEAVELAWATTETPGSYTFAYGCTDGVAVDIMNIEGLKSIACDTNYNVGNTDSLTIKVDSEKERYIDVNYTVSFLGTNDTEPRATGASSLTVINGSVQEILADDVDAEIVDDVVTPDEETETAEPTAPAAPTYEQEFVYTIPVSDPNGHTDLFTRYLNLGTIVGNTFFAGTVEQNETGAIQFEVKNNGTKTSGEWTYKVTLPNDSTYSSTIQNPLKPNERAVLTIGFPTTDTSSHTFKVTVSESTDQNTLNNEFRQTVTFLK